MPPKRKKKKPEEKVQCDQVEGERFFAIPEDVFKFNWWEIFCFPYILCSRVWDCCASLCSGANQCLVYWLMIQWVVCKISKLTTPDPIIFPYYFYMFCQVIILTVFFVMLWVWFGRTVFVPFFLSIWTTLAEDEEVTSSANKTRLAFRKYCFRKGEIFDSSYVNESVVHKNTPILYVIVTFIDVFLFDLRNQ